ncbi:MAG: ABC transporter permease, partial [Gemmatimonadaceae bacterium]
MGDEPEGLTVNGSTEQDSRGRRAGRFTSLGADLIFALRQMRRHPAFTTVAVVTLALGIGVTTAMFSVVHRLLVDPVPFRDADRIVRLYQGMSVLYSDEANHTVLALPSIAVSRAWRDRSRTLEQVVWMSGREYSATLGRGPESEPVEAEAMSADVPSFLGVRPVLGRGFVAGEETPGAAPTAVLGYGMWR